MSYANAEQNCRNKWGSLFEPKSTSMNQDVYDATKSVPGISRGDWSDSELWIGINALRDGVYRYESDGQRPPSSFDLSNPEGNKCNNFR